jgi:RHS repeat-associated protein
VEVACDQPFARVSYGEPGVSTPGFLPEVHWLLTDHLNSVRLVLDESGTVLDQIAYDAFGNIVAQLNPLLVNPILFTSREFDAETGLYYNRARYLDPTTGRWTTQDPMGFAAGDANLYRYVGNTPTLLVDPSGYIWSWALAAKGAVIGAVVGTVGYLGFHAITGRPITWGGVVGAATGGAVAGGLAGGLMGAATGDPSALVVIGGGLLLGAGSGAVGGLVSSVLAQGIDRGQIDWVQVGVETGIGAVLGLGLGGVGSGIRVWQRPGGASARTPAPAASPPTTRAAAAETETAAARPPTATPTTPTTRAAAADEAATGVAPASTVRVYRVEGTPNTRILDR